MRIRTTLTLTAVLATGVAPLALTAPASAAAAKHYDDFNGDGYRDLAIGDRGATVVGKKKAGAVVVIWGSPTGLVPASRTVVSQSSAGIPGAAETNDYFGTDITTVDLNSDGYADVIATAPGENDGSYNGTFMVLWGSNSGLKKGSSYHNPQYKDRGFASDIAVGDFNADGKQDVVAVDDTNIWYLRGPFTKSGSRGTATNFDPTNGENIDPVVVASGKVTKDGTADFAVLGRDWDTDSDRVWFYKGGSGGEEDQEGEPARVGLTDRGRCHDRRLRQERVRRPGTRQPPLGHGRGGLRAPGHLHRPQRLGEEDHPVDVRRPRHAGVGRLLRQ